MSNTTNVKAFAAAAVDADLKLIQIDRRAVTPNDVEIEILYYLNLM